ncbi:MAG: class II aldolase/adducin family protein [Alphaproteobacteria bacterium]
MGNGTETETLADAIRMLERLGIIDFNGHCSARLADGAILVNSGRSVRSALTVDDIVAIDGDGRLLRGDVPPPLEVHIHTEIYRRRPEVAAIVHAHPTWSTLFTMTGRRLEPVFAQGALLGRLPVFDSPLSINTRDLGERVAERLGAARGILLPSHGAVVVGADIVEAFVLTVYLEQNAQRQYAAESLGVPYAFSDAEVDACRRTLFKRSLFAKCWAYYAAKFGPGAPT